SGTVHARQPSLDLIWNLALQQEAASGAGRLVLKGTARGPLPPAVDGVIEGTLSAGREEVTLAGSLSGRGAENRVTLEARGLGGRRGGRLVAEAAGGPGRVAAPGRRTEGDRRARRLHPHGIRPRRPPQRQRTDRLAGSDLEQGTSRRADVGNRGAGRRSRPQ